ncbi:MAG: HAD family hydrolase [Bryobacterales bacterium]|jgi:putative hydrolase of the HAD superfamily|nr:HAD family hydrolase [Bryobacterales bacterium]
MRQHLIIDADDTLWENNIYFEHAFSEFVDFLGHSTLNAHEVRAILDEIEIANIRINGYGSLNFGRNLRQCYQKLCERDIGASDLDTVMSFAERILDRPVELIDGVEETLAYLAERHDLTLFTKGHPDEQKLKIDRSGLERYFGRAEIVREKDRPAYERLVVLLRAEPAVTWMVGNSPKSDINPALAAGLRAVFVPHPNTWGLEHEHVDPDHGRLLVVERFTDLKRHF